MTAITATGAVITWTTNRRCMGAVDFGTTAPNPETGGLLGTYYSGRELSGDPILVRSDAQVDFPWGYNAPAPEVTADNYSVRWTGRIRIDMPGVYTFYTVTDDGVRLYVDNALLVDKWIDQALTEYSGTANLAAGWHDLRMEYFEGGVTACAHLWYSGPGVTKQIIPGAVLARDASGAYGTSAREDEGFRRQHRVELKKLPPGTACHYRIRSAAPDGNGAMTGDLSFTTTP
ncbi:MAG: PA14 domain-containing protein [Planctomycetota bacterium]